MQKTSSQIGPSYYPSVWTMLIFQWMEGNWISEKTWKRESWKVWMFSSFGRWNDLLTLVTLSLIDSCPTFDISESGDLATLLLYGLQNTYHPETQFLIIIISPQKQFTSCHVNIKTIDQIMLTMYHALVAIYSLSDSWRSAWMVFVLFVK